MLPTDVGPLVAQFLRSIHPVGTAKGVARDTGISPAAVEKLLERQSTPNAANLLRLIAAYGPAFLSAVLPGSLGWLSEAAREQEVQKLEDEIKARRQRLASLRGAP